MIVRAIRKAGRIVAFVAFYMWDLARSNVRVARHILSPRLRARPAVVAVPLEELTDMELLVLTGLVTITPGSLTLDVSADGRTLYVHLMDAPDPEAVRRFVKEELEGRILEVSR